MECTRIHPSMGRETSAVLRNLGGERKEIPIIPIQISAQLFRLYPQPRTPPPATISPSVGRPAAIAGDVVIVAPADARITVCFGLAFCFGGVGSSSNSTMIAQVVLYRLS